MVMVYAVTNSTTARPALILNWMPDLGEWIPSVTQPPVFCWDDLTGLAEEVERCQEASKKITNAWNGYRVAKPGAKGIETWEAYQGALAAHYFRMYEPEDPKPSPAEELVHDIQTKMHSPSPEVLRKIVDQITQDLVPGKPRWKLPPKREDE